MKHYMYDDNSGTVIGYEPNGPEADHSTVLEQYPATDVEEANRLICQLYLKQPEILNSKLKWYLDSCLRSKKCLTEGFGDTNFYKHQAYGAVMYHTYEHPEDQDVWFHLWMHHYREQFGF